MNTPFQKIFAGSDRTITVKKNIIGSFCIKGLSILTSFFLVPFTISLLNREKYGIWITIFSIVSWFNMMDIGLGNGFRNKFAEALAVDNKRLAKEYIQALYSSMIIIAAAILMLFFILNHYISWNNILNVPAGFDEDVQFIAAIVFTLFCLQLVLKNVSTIFLSLQKTTLSNTLIFFGNLVSLVLIFLFNKFYTIDLLSVAIIFMLSPVIVFSIATFFVFNYSLKGFRPVLFALPKISYFKELMNLGFKFFLIQITTVVMFSSSSIIITQLYGPAAVTPYNVTYQLFAAAQVFFSIIVTPFWAAFTDANAKQDLEWIKGAIKKLQLLWFFFSLGVLTMWLFSPVIFKLWLGGGITVTRQLSFQFALFVILITWSSIFSFFLAGIGKITISLYGALFQFIFYIPLAIFLAKGLKLNTVGIILSTNINLLIPAVFLFLQTKKIINKKAYGIWSR